MLLTIVATIIGVTFLAGGMPAYAATIPAITAVGVAPLGSPVVVDVGTLAGEVLTWTAAIIGPPLAAVVGLWLQRWAKQIGLDVTDKDRARLDQFVQNGIELAVQQSKDRLEKLDDVQVRNRALALGVVYAQRHGRDTLKRLGAPDPTSPEVEDALRARAARILNSVAPPA